MPVSTRKSPITIYAIGLAKKEANSLLKIVTKENVADEKGFHFYSSREELLSDERIDLVTIATPNDVHKEIAIDAMRHGKNVISEKPVMLSLEELDTVIGVANECGKLFTVHQNRRWDGENLVMKGIYESGELGKIFHIENKVLGSRGIPGDWRAKPEHGGGMVYDWGIHLLDQAMMMTLPRKVARIPAQPRSGIFSLKITSMIMATKNTSVSTNTTEDAMLVYRRDSKYREK